MADNEYLIALGADLDTNDLNKKILEAGKQAPKIVLKLDDSDVTNKLKSIQSQLKAIQNTKITLNLNGSGRSSSGGIGNSTKNITDVKRAYQELMSLQRRIGSYEFKIDSLDTKKDIQQISILEEKIVELGNRFRNTFDQFKGQLSVSQLDNLSRGIEVAYEKIDILGGKLADDAVGKTLKQQSEEVKSAYQETLSLIKEIGSKETKLKGLDPQKDAGQITILNQQLVDLKAKYDNLRSSFDNKFDLGQLVGLHEALKETASNIDLAEGKAKDKSVLEGLKQQAEQVRQQVEQTQEAYKELFGIASQANSKRLSIAGLDSTKDAHQIEELRAQLQFLMTDYNNLFRTNKGRFSTEQLDGLNRVFDETSKKIDVIDAKLADKSAIQTQTQAFKELESVATQMNKLELKIRGLDPNKNSSEISVLTEQLEQLRNEYINLQNTTNGQLSDSQLASLGKSFYDLQDKLKLLDAKIADTKAKIAEGFVAKFDDRILGDTEKIEAGLSKIANATDETTAAYEKFTNAVNEMNLTKQNGDVDEITNAYKNYETQLKNIETQLKKNQRTESEANKLDELQQKKNKLAQDTQIWLKENSAAVGKFGDEIRELLKELEQCDNVSFSRIKSKIEGLERQAKLDGVTGLNNFDKLKDQLGKLGIYFSASAMITSAISGLRDMYDNVVKIDSAMTELKKVTDETDRSYKQFTSNAGKTAAEIGTTVDDYITSTADFARLGYTFDESQNLAKVANVYNVVGDDLDGIDEATEDLISVLKAFNIQAEDSVSIVDKLNEVGVNLAS